MLRYSYITNVYSFYKRNDKIKKQTKIRKSQSVKIGTNEWAVENSNNYYLIRNYNIYIEKWKKQCDVWKTVFRKRKVITYSSNLTASYEIPIADAIILPISLARTSLDDNAFPF